MADTPAPSAAPSDPLAGTGLTLPGTTGTLMERMGITFVEVGARRTVATMPVAGNTQPFGVLHGGASAALAETVGSYAAQVHAGPGRLAMGIELNATHHRSVREGVVTGTATALHLGSTLASYQVVVEDSGGRLLCTARLTCMLVDART